MAYYGETPGTSVSFRLNFMYGATTEIQRTMQARREAGENAAAVTALAVNHKAAVDEYVKKHLKTQSRPRGSALSWDDLAIVMGRKTGAKLERSRANPVRGG